MRLATAWASSAGDPRPAPPIVLYAPLGELKVYEISEAELEKLEAGPPGQIHLSFALALLPAALTILPAEDEVRRQWAEITTDVRSRWETVRVQVGRRGRHDAEK